MADEELIKRPLDEEFDTMMEVQRNPCGAWVAIQEQAYQIEALETKLAKAVEAIKTLNSACDEMWNDHERLEENPDRFGQDYRLKEIHMRAISEAQQKLPSILSNLETKL